MFRSRRSSTTSAKKSPKFDKSAVHGNVADLTTLEARSLLGSMSAGEFTGGGSTTSVVLYKDACGLESFEEIS